MLTYAACNFCPRECRVDRTKEDSYGYCHGYCHAPGRIMAAKAMLHQGEEPCLIGPPGNGVQPDSKRHGAGAVFFSHCNLRCVFCQNQDISLEGKGKEISEERLAEIILNFQDAGAACIDLVTPTPYLLSVVHVLEQIKPRLTIPVVYNCGGYESAQALSSLDGLVDVYLPDLKYKSPALSLRYSKAADYFEKASKALKEMVRQTGPIRFGDDGQLLSGVLVRHLVLPGCHHDSLKLMDYLGSAFPKGSVYISLLRQYTPYGNLEPYPELKRRVTGYEYNQVVDRALLNHLDGYIQNKSSATMELKPDFDFSGL